jgi:hypothetical protein
MSIEEARVETRQAWERSYSAERNAEAIAAIADRPFQYRAGHLVARLFFRGIYFPQMSKSAWARVIFQNRRTIYRLTREAVSTYRVARKRRAGLRSEDAHAR